MQKKKKKNNNLSGPIFEIHSLFMLLNISASYTGMSVIINMFVLCFTVFLLCINIAQCELLCYRICFSNWTPFVLLCQEKYRIISLFFFFWHLFSEDRIYTLCIYVRFMWPYAVFKVGSSKNSKITKLISVGLLLSQMFTGGVQSSDQSGYMISVVTQC